MHDAAACVTVTGLPAIVSVAVRVLVVVFAVAEKLTVPLPAPVLPLLIVSQLVLLVAVQEQVLPAVTPTDPVPADEASVMAEAVSE